MLSKNVGITISFGSRPTPVTVFLNLTGILVLALIDLAFFRLIHVYSLFVYLQIIFFFEDRSKLTFTINVTGNNCLSENLPDAASSSPFLKLSSFRLFQFTSGGTQIQDFRGDSLINSTKK